MKKINTKSNIINDNFESEKQKFIFNITKDTPHGEKTFFEHLSNTSKIVKNFFPNEEYLIDAALYHSVYGTSYFKFDAEVNREEVKKIIGDHAEELAYRFCTLENRTQQILEHKFDDALQRDLYILEYANLLDQVNQCSIYNIKLIKSRLKDYYNIDVSLNPLKNQLHVIDNKFTRSELRSIHYYCYNSGFRLMQRSDILNHQRDLRFASHVSKEQLLTMQVIPSLDKICKELNIKLYLKNYYINHYSQMSYVAKHTDEAEDGYASILVFCNHYWDETWGGELKVYQENSSTNKAIDFVPGRIIIFDSKIEHKVLPLTPFSEQDRFSLAIKAVTDPTNLQDFEFQNLIQIGNE